MSYLQGAGPRVAASVLAILVSASACDRSSPPSTRSASSSDPPGPATSSAAPPPEAPKRATPTLPAEPPPSLPHLTSEVPDLAAKLAANKTYAAIWDPAHAADRTLLLTALSQLLAEDAIREPVIAPFQANAAVGDAVTKLYLIHARTGSFPTDFMTGLRKYLDTVKAAPRLGVWSPYKKGQPPEDYTALALWVNRDRPEYVRELLAARKGDGVQTWYDHEKPVDRPYLAEEKAALEWLALLTTLEPVEQARLDTLRREASIVRTPIETLLAEYKDNEVRADGKFKGKVVQVTGLVGDVKKDVLDHIYVAIGTGKLLEIPVVQCFVASNQVEQVTALSKGDKVTVRGRVDGLLMNVLVKECELVK